MKTNRDLVMPGVMRCAKCGFVLVHNAICTESGAVGWGKKQPARCPNRCGALRRMTWQQQAEDLEVRCIGLLNRALDAEAGAGRMRDALAGLERHVALEAFDEAVYLDGRIIGSKKPT